MNRLASSIVAAVSTIALTACARNDDSLPTEPNVFELRYARPVAPSTGPSATILPSLAQGSSEAVAINDAQEIAGSSVTYPVRWSRAGSAWTVERLGTSTGTAADINEAGTVVGSSGGNIVLWRRDGSTSVISGARAVALNESETVVGFAAGNVAWVWVKSAGQWTPHILSPLVVGGTVNEPNDINENGVIVGFSYDANGVQHAVKWVPSITTPGEWDAAVPLDSHAGLTNSAALGIDGNAVIGLIWRCTSPTSPSTCTSREPFDWSLDAQASYGSLGSEDAWAEGLNASHFVVGMHLVRTNRKQELRAFVWSPAAPTITDLPAAKGYAESWALDINNPTVTRSSKQVVGRGVAGSGERAALVWILP